MPAWVWWICGGLGLAALYTVVPEAVFHLLHAGTLARGTPHQRAVALTFDDGPDPRYTPECLDILREAGVSATFFVVAERAAKHPELIARMIQEGHEVASHSARHRHHWTRGPVSTWLDIAGSKRLLEELTGRPVRFYRPPWGAFNLCTRIACSCLRLKPVLWSVRAIDWRPDSRAADIARRIVTGAAPGAIVLCHDAGGSPGAAREMLAALREVVKQLRDLGFTLTTVGEIERMRQEQRARQQARRRGYPVPRRWVVDFWALIEWGFTVVLRIRPVDAMFRVCPAVWRHGRRRDARTGQLLVDDGNAALDLHIQNDTVTALSTETDHRALVTVLRYTRDGLRNLARLLANHPDYGHVRVIMAKTLMNRGLELLGFHVEDVPRTWGTRIDEAYLRFLLGLYHPAGFRRLRQGLQPTKLKLVWITREELLALYGPGQDAGLPAKIAANAAHPPAGRRDVTRPA
ncbi:MAG: polysaccharide deacetylase family protein, partial [Alicyclobacillaceae bacterium]|nr:polysaccharide deacetylase family protein [Alicyclobacillaceae bacterium]